MALNKFAHKNTYNEAIFDLRPKRRRKTMLKSGIPDINPKKTFYWLYRPFNYNTIQEEVPKHVE